MSADDEKIAKYGDYRQAERLNQEKAARQQMKKWALYFENFYY